MIRPVTRDRGAQLRLLLDMLRRLAAGAWTPDALAADLHISRRTVLRILAEFRGAGILDSLPDPLGLEAHVRVVRHVHRLRPDWLRPS